MDQQFKYQIHLVGDISVGKTNIVQKFIYDEIKNIGGGGLEYFKKQIQINKDKIILQIQKYPGNQNFMSMTKYQIQYDKYNPVTRAIMIVYDITDYSSFKFAKYWVEEIRQTIGNDVILFLIGNKLDLQEKRKVSKEEIDIFCQEKGIQQYEVSAVDGTNIQYIFRKVAQILHYFQKNIDKEFLIQQDKNQQIQRYKIKQKYNNVSEQLNEQEAIKVLQRQQKFIQKVKDDKIQYLQKRIVQLEEENLKQSEIIKKLKNKYKFNNQKQNFYKFTNDMAKQFNIHYEDLIEFENKFKLGEIIGSGSYGTVRDLIQIQQCYNDKNDDNQQLVVKQLDCQKYDQELQEIEVTALQKVQLLPQQFRNSILEMKNVYWDPIKQKINLILPKAKCSLEEEIQTKIINNSSYSQNELCKKLSCALEGLLTLETLGMVHRDIKTSNMLIMPDESLVLADLGTAKILDYQIATMTIGIGTQKYWPPEQIEAYIQLKNEDYYEYIQSDNAKRNFKANDLYGVGLSFIIAASLNKLPPFKPKNPKFLQIFKEERETWLEQIFKKLKEEKNFTPDLISLLENMVSSDQSKRFSLLEVAKKLCQVNW